MNWFKTLFAAPKTINDVLDKDNGLIAQAGGWIGNLSFTDQEKAVHTAEIAKGVTDFVKVTLTENTTRSVARRQLAVMWMRVQLALILMVAITIPWKKDIAVEYFNLATCDVMLWGTGSIIVFFFGGYVWGTHVAKK